MNAASVAILGINVLFIIMLGSQGAQKWTIISIHATDASNQRLDKIKSRKRASDEGPA